MSLLLFKKGYCFDDQGSFVNYNDELEKAKSSYSTSKRVLVIEDADGFLKELCRFAFGCPDGFHSLICSSFLNDMIQCGIMKRYEGLANHLQSVGLNRDASTSGKEFSEKGKNEILDDYQKSNDELLDPPSFSVPELSSSEDDSTNSSQTNDFDSQESSESKRPWYERLKPCAGDIYIHGKPINRTCEEYCLVSHDNAESLTDKFYNMNSDGFKKQLERIRKRNPFKDLYYLLDLVLCAHVRKGYSFDLSRNGPEWERFERQWINWIRRDKHRIQKKGEKN